MTIVHSLNAKELAARLAARAADVAEYLLPQGKRAGREWKAGSVHGEPGGSLSVRVSGDASKLGTWSDFAQPGTGGDLLDLWAAARGLSISDAMNEVKAWLGVSETSVSTTRAFKAQPYRRPPEIKAEAPTASRVIQWLEGRGISEETARAFRIGEKIEGDRCLILFPYYREDGTLINIKHRDINDKHHQRQVSGAEPCLMGWHLIKPDARVVAITEGEPDAMVLHQMGIPALSVNQGAKNHQWLDADFDRLQRFSEILVCFDDDEAGHAGREQLVERLGRDRCKIVTFPGVKDANDYLKAGATPEDFAKAIREAKSMDPDELKSIADFRERTIDLFYPKEFNEPPLVVGLEKHTWMRFRGGEVTLWTGRNGHGKSAFLTQQLMWIMAGTSIPKYDGSYGEADVPGQRICVFSGELPGQRQAQRLIRQLGGVKHPTRGYINHIVDWLDDKMWVFDMVGAANVDRLLEVFTYAYRRYGMTQFVIDSLMTTDVPVDGPRALSEQKKFMQKISAFAKRHFVHVHLVAHPRKSEHDSDKAGKSDVGGSGDLTNLAENVISVWANLRDKEAHDYDPLDADGRVTLMKQRNGDVQLRGCKVYFNADCGQYSTHHSRSPIEFLEVFKSPFKGEPEMYVSHSYQSGPPDDPTPPPVDTVPAFSHGLAQTHRSAVAAPVVAPDPFGGDGGPAGDGDDDPFVDDSIVTDDHDGIPF